MKTLRILIFLNCLSVLNNYGQTKLNYSPFQKDSIKKLINSGEVDSVRAVNLNLYSSLIRHVNTDSAILLNNQALEISKKINWRFGILESTFSLGKGEYIKGDFTKSLTYLINALKLADELNRVDKQVEIKRNIGNVYVLKQDYAKALGYYFMALKSALNLNNKNLIAATYNNIGLAYTYKGDKKLGLEYLLKSLQHSNEIHDEKASAVTMDFIGYTYYLLENYPLALEYLTKSLEINRRVGDKIRILDNLRNIGEVKIKTNKYIEAERCFEEALKYSEELGHLHGIETNHEALSKLYEANGKSDKALLHYKKYITVRDSFKTLENEKKQLETEMTYEFETKQAITKEQNDKEKAVLEERKKLQDSIILSVVIGLIIVLFFTFFILRTLRLTKSQKLIIEQKQTEILDSITYAKRIQNTLLAHSDFVNENLPDNFILFKPKDIVSGDFYWATQKNNKFYLAVCDSTGHGVPGAFMSLLNIGFINEAINEKNIDEPHAIFNYVREKLILSIGKDGQKDGFDGILLCLDKTKNKISYTAAHNSPVIISNNNLVELESDRMPVGIGERKSDFIQREIPFKKDDILYLYTDGFADQFGGPKGKKFKYKQLNELLHSAHQLPLNEQMNLLENTFTNWKGNLEQVDDVLIIGIKI